MHAHSKPMAGMGKRSNGLEGKEMSFVPSILGLPEMIVGKVDAAFKGTETVDTPAIKKNDPPM